MMEKAELSQYIDLIISNEDVTKAKPDPEMYATAITRLNMNPEECLVIEDNPNGIEAGKRSGAHVMSVSSIYEVNYENIVKHIEGVEKS